MTLCLSTLDTAIVVEEHRKHRKVRKEEFNEQKDRDSLWMGRTIKHINRALEVYDKQDQGLDKEQERLIEQRERVKEQREILKSAKEYIIRCGAIEDKVTRRWEKT
jgi:hypothetical protein